MRHEFLPRGTGRVVAALVLVGLAAMLGTGDAIARPGDKHKSIDHGYLGVYMQDLTRNVRRGLDLDVTRGVLISGVVDESPAEKAGIEDGDVIVKFAGKKVSDSDDLSDFVRDAEPGTEVEIELIRDGETMTLTLAIGERPEEFVRTWDDFDFGDFDFGDFEFDMGEFGHRMRDIGHTVSLRLGGPRLGVYTHELNEGLADYFDTEGGVLVLDVADESVAQEAGVKAGDVVKKIAGENIENTRDIREALHDLEDGDKFDVTVLRKGKTKTLKATMTEDAMSVFGRAPRIIRRHMNGPRIHINVHEDRIREELDELREELRELRREIKKGRDG